METTNPSPRRFSTEMVEVFNNFLDKIQPALRSGGMPPEERAQLTSLVQKVQTLEGREIPAAYDDAPLTARLSALEQKPQPTPYDDTELRGKINALELREDQVGVTAEEMGRAITAAIAALPPDEVGISEERVQELIAAIRHYDDTALSGRVQALEEREMPTPYNDTELRGKVVALETLPTGLDALKARVANLEVNAGNGASGGETPDLTRVSEDIAERTNYIREFISVYFAAPMEAIKDVLSAALSDKGTALSGAQVAYMVKSVLDKQSSEIYISDPIFSGRYDAETYGTYEELKDQLSAYASAPSAPAAPSQPADDPRVASMALELAQMKAFLQSFVEGLRWVDSSMPLESFLGKFSHQMQEAAETANQVGGGQGAAMFNNF